MSDFNVDPGIVDWAHGPSVIALLGTQSNAQLQRAHHHARGQLLGSIQGLLTVGVYAGLWVVPALHAVWLPPRHVHWARANGRFEGWSVYVKEALCGPLPAVPCMVRTSGLLREAVLRAATWGLEDLDGAREHIAQVIVGEIAGSAAEPLGLPMPREARLQRVAQALLDDPASHRDVRQWADLAAVSVRTLSRRFVVETGFTFTAWRQRARLLRALELLASGHAVNVAALELGYATASAFIAEFRQQFGETPADYRQRLALR